ncbi:putative membrane protein, partial [Yersinia pestis PY-64]
MRSARFHKNTFFLA